MATLLSWGGLAQRAKALVAQVNPLDNGRTYNTVMNNQPPPQAPPGVQPASAFQQLTHNGITNTVGNMAVKPFVMNPLEIAAEAIRQSSAGITNNQPALNASNARQLQNIKASIPGWLAQQADNAGTAGYNLGFKAPILDLKGNAPAAEQARTVGINEFNRTGPGQLLSPLERGIAAIGHANNAAKAKVGLDPNATFAQKFIGDPVVGALSTYGAAKGLEGAGKTAVKGGKAVVAFDKAQSETGAIGKDVKPTQGAKPNVPEVASRADSPKNVQMVPTSELAKYMQHDRGASPLMSADEYAQLKADIQKNGIQRPLQLNYGAKDKVASLGEGNHRLAIAKELGIKELPVEVTGTSHNIDTLQGKGYAKVAGRTPDENGYVPSNQRPSDIGVKVTQPTQGAKPNVPEVPQAKVTPPAQVALKLSRGLENTKMPGALKRALISSTGVIHNLGEGGREIAKRVSEQRFQSETRQEAFYKQIPTVMKLNKDQFRNFVDTLNNKGKAQPGLSLHPDVAKAVGEWQKAIVDIPKQAEPAGIDMGNLGKNYFPRIHKDLFSTGKGEARMLDRIIKSQKDAGKDINRGDATAILNKMRKGYNKEYGNLTKSRLADIPGYEKTHEAMTTYIDKAFGHITHAEQFGPKGELLKKMIDNISRQGHDTSENSIVGKHLNTIFDLKDKQGTGYKVSAGVRQVNAFRSLGSAAISNATQLTNTAAVAGLGRTAKGIYKFGVSKEARDRAKASGVLLDHAIANLSTGQLGVGGRVARNVASPFFSAVEKFNRETTAIVGHDYGNHLAAKAAQGNTRAEAVLRDKFGLEGPIGKTLTEDQSKRMASKLVEISQFKVDPQDLPNWVDSPLGKLSAQFRTFGYKQTGFMWNEVLRQALRGNFLPLARFTAVGIPGGVASASLKAAVKGQTQPGINDKKKLALSGFNAVGGFGLPGSGAQSIATGNKYGNTAGAIGDFVGGPTAGFLSETGSNLAKAQKGQTQPLVKEGARSIPAVGPYIANKRYPSQPAPLKADTTAPPSPQQNVANAKAEKKALENDPTLGTKFTLQKLSDGKYAYTLEGDDTVHQANTLKEAQLAVGGAQFAGENGSYKIVGDTVYRKGADGNVTTTTKTKFDYQIGSATLVAQKNADDLPGWLSTAHSQLDSIVKQLKDPNIDPLDALTLQNDASKLQDEIAKYSDYGGFTKPKSGRSRVSAVKSLSSSFKTAGKQSIPTPKGISVRVPQASFKAPKSQKLSVSNLPSNYLSKKLR